MTRTENPVEKCVVMMPFRLKGKDTIIAAASGVRDQLMEESGYSGYRVVEVEKLDTIPAGTKLFDEEKNVVYVSPKPLFRYSVLFEFFGG